VPFTVSHAAAAYPFRRTRLVLSALIIGTFAPDLEFFVRFAPKGPFGHTERGLFLFALPAAFMMFWLYEEVVKQPLAALLPLSFRRRLSAEPCHISLRRPRRLLLVVVSILIGAATHIVWDSFTHERSWPWHAPPVLLHTMTLPWLGPVHYYRLLQYFSSVFGLLFVFFWIWQWRRTAPLQPKWAGSSVPASQVRLARVWIPITALLGALLRAFLGTRHHWESPRGMEFWTAEFVVTLISIVWLELMVWGFTLPHPKLAPAAPGSIK
jgi:Domain of unknown function (DUF4184)